MKDPLVELKVIRDMVEAGEEVGQSDMANAAHRALVVLERYEDALQHYAVSGCDSMKGVAQDALKNALRGL